MLASLIPFRLGTWGGFAYAEDFGMMLDLPGDIAEDMRGTAIFLPR